MKHQLEFSDARPAISTIAKALQLSASTVSRALNGVYGVHADTRSRVLEKAKEIGYVPNLGAKQLVGKGSNLVGVIMPEFASEASYGFVYLLPAFARQGIEVPGRISVCGYDGDTYSAYTIPPLTTIRHSQDICAEWAVHMLQELLAGQAGRMERIPPSLLDRQSVSRIGADKSAFNPR